MSSLARPRDWLELKLFDCGVNDVVSDDFSTSAVATRITVRLADQDRMGFKPRGVQLGDTIIDVVRKEIIRGDNRILLTHRQAELMACFLNNPNRVIARDELVENIWNNKIDSDGKNLDMYIAKLRKALEIDPANPVHMLTIWSEGYRFAQDGVVVEGAMRR